MAESFIVEAVMAVLTAVLSRVAEEVKLPWSFKDDKKEVEMKLKRIHMLLCGASSRSFDNPLVDDWVNKVKKVAYDADDLLDELAYEALKQRIKHENQSKLQKKLLFCFSLRSYPIVFSFQMGHRMRQLRGSIEDVFKDAQTLGIKPVDLVGGPSTSVHVPEQVQLQVQRELVSGRGLIGRDEDEANIISMLSHPENADSDLTVVGIVGIGGLGKTALSKRVFDTSEVKKHFEKRIWVCVSHDFELKGIIEKMVELVEEETSTSSSYQAMIVKLEKNLSGKRFLLVLDDVWDTLLSVWESFRSILLDIGGSKGTVVLATSRSSQVIAAMQSEVEAFTARNTPSIYHLEGLNSFDTWSLSQQRVQHIKDVKPVNLVGGPSTSVHIPEQVQFQVQRKLVGARGLIWRDEDEANIIRMLTYPKNADNELIVVGIVGIGGIGKTALSKRVFDRSEVKKHFDKRIWVSVSHDFEVKGILEKIVELVEEETSTRSSYQAMIKKLEKNLSGKRYLLVLDDVWNTVWVSFCRILLDIGGSKGTAVLATSRSSHVIAAMHDQVQAFTAGNEPLIYQLNGLNSFDSWSLFQQRVQHIKDVTRAKRMVTKCRGIPLAINVLGVLLRNKSLEEWKQIDESELWKLEDNNDILPSLRLSFTYLPSAAVKNCFVYCAFFPQDAIISRVHLIQLWMAQGFLQPHEKMEHIGNEYFNILLNSSLFEEVEFNENGSIKLCKMHDLVHDLARAVAREEYLTLSDNVNMTKISSDVKHLSLLTEKSLPRDLKVKLRSMISESLDIGNLRNLLSHAKCLRVLSLVGASIVQLPDSIGNLKHLRFLDISENDIMEVSSAVGELYNLQTLRYYCSKVLYWSTYPRLPKELDKLVNLRYIGTSGCSCMDISLFIANPRMLQRLDQHRTWGVRISDISSLNNITGSLAIWNLEHISSSEEVKKASLRTKANIDHLDLSWSYNATCFTNPEEVLEELLPHEDLKVLNIWYYNGKALPSWLIERRPSTMPQLCNLVELKFYYCRNFKQLPASFIFPSLKVLVVWGCDNLTSFPDLSAMECLETLQIGRCPTLAYLPCLDPLTNLRRLEIHNCARLTRLPLGLSSLQYLSQLEIGPLCRDLDFFPFPDINDSCPLSQSLQNLCLIGWSKVGNLPNQLRNFTQLQTLSISRFGSLEVLPSWLGNLTSLRIVELQHMENLIYLPSRNDMQWAKRFRGFCIEPFQCPKLNIIDGSSTIL